MKLRIIESKQELQAKYGKWLTPLEFDKVYNQIPENLKGYGDWIFQHITREEEPERHLDISKQISALQSFVKYKDRLETKDINKYLTTDDLEQAIEFAKEKGSKKEKTYNATVVYENNKVKVLIPLTHEASRHYGTGTKWCTATASSQHFNDYKKKGKLFYILPKDSRDKYAIFSAYILDPNADPNIRAFDKIDEAVPPADIIRWFDLPKELFTTHLEIDYGTKEGIEKFCEIIGLSSWTEVNSYKIRDNLVVDTNGTVDLSEKKLSKIPVKFGEVTGSFICHSNLLTSLEGSPDIVDKIFNCSNNPYLTSLKGSPEKIGGSFDCRNNPKLASLEGGPKIVDIIDCSENKSLTSLKGAPEEVYNDFDCYKNPKLVSLEGCPESVSGGFNCYDNANLVSLKGGPREVGGRCDFAKNPKLESLEGAPEKVGGNFGCEDDPKLTSLKGGPKKVGGGYYCNSNNLTSLEGMPKILGKRFTCYKNPKLPKSEIAKAVEKYGTARVESDSIFESIKKMKFRIVESFLDNAHFEGDTYVIYKNPTTAELDNPNESKENRGLIDAETGDLYIEAKIIDEREQDYSKHSRMIHDNLLQILQKRHGLFGNVASYWDWHEESIEDILMVHRVRKYYIFVLAESYGSGSGEWINDHESRMKVKNIFASAKRKNPSLDFKFGMGWND